MMVKFNTPVMIKSLKTTHQLDDSTERPIAYASRTLTPTERNYAQLDKEALSIFFGVKYFHQYLYGGQFTIISDHKPFKKYSSIGFGSCPALGTDTKCIQLHYLL